MLLKDTRQDNVALSRQVINWSILLGLVLAKVGVAQDLPPGDARSSCALDVLVVDEYGAPLPYRITSIVKEIGGSKDSGTVPFAKGEVAFRELKISKLPCFEIARIEFGVTRPGQLRAPHFPLEPFSCKLKGINFSARVAYIQSPHPYYGLTDYDPDAHRLRVHVQGRSRLGSNAYVLCQGVTYKTGTESFGNTRQVRLLGDGDSVECRIDPESYVVLLNDGSNFVAVKHVDIRGFETGKRHEVVFRVP
jgi:hypothetical protein